MAIKEIGAVVERPKAMGNIKGVTYTYGMFYRFGSIEHILKMMDGKIGQKMAR